MGRQSLQIQPQPEPRFITEYKKKKELHRKTQGNIFLYDFSEETNQSENGSLKCATPDLLKEVKEVNWVWYQGSIEWDESSLEGPRWERGRDKSIFWGDDRTRTA